MSPGRWLTEQLHRPQLWWRIPASIHMKLTRWFLPQFTESIERALRAEGRLPEVASHDDDVREGGW